MRLHKRRNPCIDLIKAKPKAGVVYLRENIEKCVCEIAEYIIENKATVRGAAKEFGISKSTVHMVVIKGNGL